MSNHSGLTEHAGASVHAAPAWAMEWMAERSGYTPGADAKGIVATFGGRVLGVVAFDGFTATIAQVHVALGTPRAAGILFRPAFRYAFLQANRLALVTMVDSRNTRAVGLAAGLGFREACRVRDGMALGADLILFELRREECRYLQETH